MAIPVVVVMVKFAIVATNALKALAARMSAAMPNVVKSAVLLVVVIMVCAAKAWFVIQVFVSMMEFVSRIAVITLVT